MNYVSRAIENLIQHDLNRGKSILLLGPRQTGKTTLIQRLSTDFSLSFIQPAVRLRYEQDPSQLTGEIEAFAEDKKTTPLVCIDEVQKVPEILDVVQDLIDRRIAKFILTGSSARKLRSRSKINLLPGRVVAYHLDPLTYAELTDAKINLSLEELLLYGSLPAITQDKTLRDKEKDLQSYVVTYLEEEIRAEAAVRNVGAFARFLTLAAAESGNIINFSKLSQEIGVAHTTIAGYYQILEDCLVAERIEPLFKTKMRRKLMKTPKYLLFDLGVRRLCADEGTQMPTKNLGMLFEQWVGLELLHYARLSEKRVKVYFWRDANGPEIDWVLEKEGRYIPIEVKWTDRPTLADAKHLALFKQEYPEFQVAYVVCQTPRKMKLAEKIYALPWQELSSLFV